ncbi:MAG: polyprenyl synthetase family protein [Pseudomonadota bacterium]
MPERARIERTLKAALDHACSKDAPPKISEAMRYAVLPGGAWVRPRLCLSVARACGDDEPELAASAAAALELLHCASLVHDDMPCFDDAEIRRGRLSVHRAYGEAIALLVGDGLILTAFDTVSAAETSHPERVGPLVRAVAQATGMPCGIVAGQAWESEPNPMLSAYHRAKTAALFVGASTAGAIAAGHDPEPWEAIGERIGEAYQVADDLRDAFGTEEEIGKPVGQDAAHNRPSAVAALGPEAAVGHAKNLVKAAIASIPPCPGAGALENLIRSEMTRLMPRAVAAAVA